MTRLLLVRHGQSTWNAERRWQGWADPPLSPLGERQASEAAAHLTGAGLEAAVASDLQRAQRTAELLAAVLGLGPVEIEPDLRERNVGEWTGLTVEEIETAWGDDLTAWREGRITTPPGGEETGALVDRVLGALKRIASRHAGRAVLVVSHGGVIRTLERSVGAEVRPVANLGGRWFSFDGSGLVAGDTVVLDPETVTVPRSD